MITYPSLKLLFRILPYVFLISLSVMSVLLWYNNNSLAIGGDYVVPFNPTDQITHYFSFWDFWKDLGNPVPPLLTGLPPFETLAFAALLELTKSFVLANKVFLILLTMIQSFSTFYFVTVIFRRYSSRKLVGIIASIFAIYNPLAVQNGYLTIVEPLIGRAFMPAFLGLVIDGYHKRNYALALLSGLCSIPMLESFPVGTWEIGILSLTGIALFVAYSSIFKKLNGGDLGFLGRYLGIVVVSIGLANIYQIILAAATLGMFSSVGTSFQPNFFFNEWATVWNVLRLMPLWGFYNGYVPYSIDYSQPLNVILSLAVPVLAFSSLLLSRSKTVIAISGISVMTVLSSAATNPPAGPLYGYVVTNFFPLKVFYNSIPIVQYALPLSLLLSASFTITEIYRRFISSGIRPLFVKRILSNIIPLILIGIVISSAWPLVTGEVMANWYPPGTDTRGATIPSDYYQVRDIFASVSCTCWNLLLPQPSTYIGTSWGYQGTVLLYNSLFNAPLLTGKSVSYSVGQASVQGATSFAYQIPMRIVPENQTMALGNPTSEPWTAYQGDIVTTESQAPSPYSNSSLNWSIAASNASIYHEISYRLASNQSLTDDIIVLVQGGFDLSALQFGIGDVNGNVGWFTSGPAQSENAGWMTLVAKTSTPASGYFDRQYVTTLFFRYLTSPDTPAKIVVGAILIGNLATDPITWARTLAILSIRSIILDSSITLGNLTGSADYLPSLQNQTAFENVYSGNYLHVYENRFATNEMLFATKDIYIVDNFQDITSLIRRIPASDSKIGIILRSDLPQAKLPLIQSANVTAIDALIASESIKGGMITGSSNYSGLVMLILNQAFDNSWVAYVNGTPLTGHFKAFGFANAWLATLNGQSQISISNSQQEFISLAQAGFAFGIATIILGLATVLLKRHRLKRRLGPKSMTGPQSSLKAGGDGQISYAPESTR